MRRRSVVLIAVLIADFAFGPIPWARAQSDRRLGPGELHRALDDFQIALNERWSYRHANAADVDAAIAALRQQVSAGMSVDEFGLKLHTIISLGIDGHSGVTGYQLPGSHYLPFLIEPAGDRFIALNPQRTRPAVIAEPAPDYYIGGPDTVLVEAIKRLSL